MSGIPAGYVFIQNATPSDSVCRRVSRFLLSKTTRYQECSFWKSETLGTCVVIDGDLQSTEMDWPTYHEALVHPAMLLSGGPERVLVCGGGEGATIREVLRYRCVKKVTMVDIDEEFVELCKEHLGDWSTGAFEDPRLEVVHEDIFRFLEERREPYDVIVGDLTDIVEESAPGRSFHSRVFYRGLKNLLAPRGVLATQASALALFDHEKHREIRASLSAVFHHALSYRAALDSFFVPWSFVLASDRDLPAAAGEDLTDILSRGFSDHGLELAHFDPASLAACFRLNKRIRKLIEE